MQYILFPLIESIFLIYVVWSHYFYFKVNFFRLNEQWNFVVLVSLIIKKHCVLLVSSHNKVYVNALCCLWKQAISIDKVGYPITFSWCYQSDCPLIWCPWGVGYNRFVSIGDKTAFSIHNCFEIVFKRFYDSKKPWQQPDFLSVSFFFLIFCLDVSYIFAC